MRLIAIINQESGVGKTTITANLGHALSLYGKRIMVVDLDSEGQLSASLGLFRPPRQGVDHVMLAEADLDSVSLSTREELMLVPAGENLSEVERQSEGGVARARLLQEGIARKRPEQDFVFFDCPPASELLMANAILAVDEVIIPVAGDSQDLNGLKHLLKILKRFEPLRERPLPQRAMLSRLNPRRKLEKEVAEKLAELFPSQLLATQIREATVLAECSGVGRTIFEYRPKSRSAKDFATLAEDLIEGRML